MDRELAQAKCVKEAYTADLLRKRNVVGVGLGYKRRRGKNTGELSIVVSVTRKQPAAALSSRDLVPPQIATMDTDVVETGVLRALPAAGASPGPRDKWRPAPPGISLGHYRITAGTFGCLVQRGGELFILSNNHVLANSNAAEPFDAILQPGPVDGGGMADRVARLADFVTLVFETEPSDCEIARLTANWLNKAARVLGSCHSLEAVKRSGEANRVDAALARPESPDQVTNEILGIGPPVGAASARLGARVQKAGRTTGVTEGTVLQVEATVRVNYAGPEALFRNQVVASAMSEGGDSGSAVLDVDKRVVGLLFAGSPATTIFNPIDAVLSSLDVELA